LNATLEDIYTDVWAHAHIDDPKLRDEIVSEDFEADLAAMEAEAKPVEPAPAVTVLGDEDFEEIASDRWPSSS
jgi:hypothetical protein